MILFVVGIDGSGKTTFITEAAKKYNMDIYKHNSKNLEYWNNVDLLYKAGKNIIFDRCNIIDGLVYDDFERKYLFEPLLGLLKREDVFIVYLKEEVNVCLDRCYNRDGYVSEKYDHLYKIANNYDTFFKEYNIKYYTKEEIILILKERLK